MSYLVIFPLSNAITISEIWKLESGLEIYIIVSGFSKAEQENIAFLLTGGERIVKYGKQFTEQQKA